MAPLVIKLVLAPALVTAATLAERRWGPRAAGVLSALPAIVGPLLLVTSLEHGVHAAARTAVGTLVGLVALSAFAVAYAEMAGRLSWGASLAAGWFAAALAATVASAWAGGVGAMPGAAIAGLSLAVAAVALGRRRRLSGLHPSLARPRSTALWPRAVGTALLVTLLSWAVSWLGPTAGGMLAALPVVASMLATLTHRGSGPAAAVELLRGTITGMAGFVVFCGLVALTIASAGTAAAFALATTATLLLQAPLTRQLGCAWGRRSAVFRA